jgi:hypothetical protein
MVTLYHVNHGYGDCVPGTVFDLRPLPDTADYEEWRRAFPEGVSLFGFRHITPDQPFSDVPESKRKMEWECKCVRMRHFPGKRSRYQSFFGLASPEGAIAFRDDAKLTGSIWEFEAECVHHKGDMCQLYAELFDEDRLLAYWKGEPLGVVPPIWECLVVPPVTMVRCVVAQNEAKP